MAFEGFQLSQIDVGEVVLNVRHGGSGPPLLLLHGYPQTHRMWAKVAAELAADFTVVAPDLRGYGKSGKPATTTDHEPYSKRAMARDAVALMASLGFTRFGLAGHDRGGRVAYRAAIDHPQAIARVSVLDVIPTGEVWARADRRFALGYWHWAFLAQPAPFPERVIGADPENFIFGGLFPGAAAFFEPNARAEYLTAFGDPQVIHASCEDYRAGAGYDRVLDAEDMRAGRRISCPTQVLWGEKGAVGKWYDVLEVWRSWATVLTGQSLDCGHFLPEERPAETAAALRAFFSQGL